MSGKSWQEYIQRRQMREAMRERAEHDREDSSGVLDVPRPFSVAPFFGGRRAAELEPGSEELEHEL